MPILTFIDTLGIQSFIFSSNRLKDVIGGSELVSQATSRQGWIRELGYKNNVIVGAGGNLLLQFEDKEEAKTFAAKFSRKALNEAPGLEVALVHHKYDTGQLAQAIQEIQIKIENHKLERCPSVPLLGLGVTAACRESQRPAVTLNVEGEGEPIAGEVAVRRQDTYQNQKRWLDFLPCNYETFKLGKGVPVELTFPLELDDLGRSYGDLSLMGVVHIDGNGIGQKLKSWLDDQQGQNDATVCNEYKVLSHELDNITEKIFKTLIDRIISAIKWEDQRYTLWSEVLQSGFPLYCRKEHNNKQLQLFLPIRPILLGGDDMTFVCDGRIALDLAATALAEFEKISAPEQIGSVKACAGVTLVKTHTPFARAYKLAESLCISAKHMLQEKNWTDRSALDWHIGLSSPSETLNALRQRQYGDKLTCRPYLLRQYAEYGFEPSWNWLAEEVLGTTGKGFRTSDPEKTPNWTAHRSKLKALREIVRKGPDEVKNALDAWKVAHPKLNLPDKMEKGFIGGRTPFLDAVELLDIHFPLGCSGE